MLIFNKRLLYTLETPPLPEPEIEFTFMIIPSPETATVTINGEVGRSITAPEGTEINWSVSADGYVTQTGSLVLEEDKELSVALEKESTTTTLALSSATQNATTSQYGIYYRFITLKYTFVAGHNYEITYTQSTNCSFGGAGISTTNQSSTELINGNPIDNINQGGGISSDVSTTIPAGTYTRTFTATKNASYLYFYLSLMNSAPNLSGNVVVVDNQ